MQEFARPLTHVEQQIWTSQQMAGHSPIHNMVLAMSLPPIDQQRFVAAHEHLARSFAPLRASVHLSAGVPTLHVAADAATTLTLVDLREEQDAEAAAQAWVEREAARTFEHDELLCRSALLRYGDDSYIWFVNQHHIITDAWSCTLLLAAMDQAYQQQTEPTVSNNPIGQPAQGTLFDEDRLESARQHWRQVYRSVPQQDAVFGRLNSDRDYRSERAYLRLDPDTVNELQAVASREFPALSGQMSLFCAFSALLIALISRISHRSRIGFETPFANRVTSEDRRTPGLFIELYPLVGDVTGDTTFAELGQQIRSQLSDLMRYGLPGASIPASDNHCDAVLNFIPFKLGTFNNEPVSAEFVHPDVHENSQPLRLQVWDLQANGGLTLMFDMNSAIVARDEHATVVEYFQVLMQQLLQEPDTAIAGVPLLADAHRAQVVEEFNKSAGAPLPDSSILQSIYEQAGRTPAATALEHLGDKVSYSELVTRVDAVASQLQSAGVSRGDRVCISADRSIALITSILGVLRLGATFVPIDPGYPASRRAVIYEAVRPKLLITGAVGDSAAPDATQQLSIDALATNSAAEQPSSDLPDWADLRLDDVAYILFTSGSTGTPKGVPVAQRGLAVYLNWGLSVYADEQAVTMPLVTSIAFDLTITSMFLPLLCGGTVIIYTPTTDAFDDALLCAIEENRVNTVKLTPSHLRLLQRTDLHRSAVRNLIVGGEQFTLELAEKIDRQFGDVRIFNEYGPTEAVVGCMIHQFDPEKDREANAGAIGSSAVPIGVPAEHTRIYVLNSARQPVHPGVTGELYVFREGAPQAYFENPEATAAAFFPDLVAPDRQMYRTGDLARFNERGELVFLGRADQQLKIAGHRVETEEIESTIMRIADVDACSVILDSPPEASSTVVHCSSCGIGSDTPGIRLDENDTCNLCHDFSRNAERIEAYFRGRDALREQISAAGVHKTGEYDCMVLLSGGKDSTYALYQVVGLGFNVYAFTLDNGYMSEDARANVQRVVDDLGIKHEFASTEHMPEIFRDSLSRFSNVCQGCFKTIYTLSLRRANELGIPTVVTGISRGQLFETRLNVGLFRGNRSDEEIDHAVLQARKAYHRRNDAVTSCLGNDEFKGDGLFERIQLIDFYRYWSASLTEMFDFLTSRSTWVRPADTGRSTNCLINDVGIYVHRKERRFHNYALPYSWDVRLAQKDRDQAIHELNDEIDAERVSEILDEIAYQPVESAEQRPEQLVAFFSASSQLDPEALRARAAESMPGWAVPNRFVQVDSIPLTINNKVDREALLARLSSAEAQRPFRAPESDAEQVTAELWSQLLAVQDIGLDDNFFELGGTSIEAIEFMTRLGEQFGVELPLELIFNDPVLSDIAAALETAILIQINEMSAAEVSAELGSQAN